MKGPHISIDRLIEIVSRGGSVRTGINVYNKRGTLLIEKSVRIANVQHLLVLKSNGLLSVPFDPGNRGGLWDKDGNPIAIKEDAPPPPSRTQTRPCAEVEQRIQQIEQIKQEAFVRHDKAKKNIRIVMESITSGKDGIDIGHVSETISDVIGFINQNETAFSYISSDIFHYDEYLYNHSVNVCTIGTAILKRFNDHFSRVVNNALANAAINDTQDDAYKSAQSFIYYLPEDMADISLGFFLHDIGLTRVSQEILNKKGPLTPKEYAVVKTHSHELGMELLDRFAIDNPFVRNCVRYHHGALFNGEPSCYPDEKQPIETPPYVKVCRLADVYDAMTSKRCYREAFNPVGVVTELFRKYAHKDQMLQFIIHAFVKVVGIYPPGSILHLQSGQMAYILDANGPIVVPFTDKRGHTLKLQADPIDLSLVTDPGLQIDRRRPLKSPIEVVSLLPPYLKKTVKDNP